QARKRDQKWKKQHLEQERAQHFEQQFKNWKRAQEIKLFVKDVSRRAVLHSEHVGSFKEVTAWVRWALTMANSIDPLTSEFMNHNESCDPLKSFMNCRKF
ncbi:MAG: hypothetical protein COB59_12200, partial [Rhodospirillaceae bacterium]